MDKNLQSALKKVKLSFSGDSWHGCLTPAEIVALIDAGALPTKGNKDFHLGEKWIRENKKSGDCRPLWFYFLPGKLKLDMTHVRHGKKPH